MKYSTSGPVYSQKAAAKFLGINSNNFKRLVRDKIIEVDDNAPGSKMFFRKDHLEEVKIQLQRVQQIGFGFNKTYPELLAQLKSGQHLKPEHGKFECLIIKLQKDGVIEKPAIWRK